MYNTFMYGFNTRASVCCAKNRKLERANDQRTASAEQPSEQSLREATQGGWETTTAAHRTRCRVKRTDRNAAAWHHKVRYARQAYGQSEHENETYTRRKLLEESTSPGLQKNKPGTTEMPKTEGAQLACEGTGPPGPAACLANFYRCPHRPSRA